MIPHSTISFVATSLIDAMMSWVFRLWVTLIEVSEPSPIVWVNFLATTVVSIDIESAPTVMPVPEPMSMVFPVFVRPEPAVI